MEEINNSKKSLSEYISLEHGIIVILFVVVVYLVLYKSETIENIVKQSSIEGTGRGVFAGKDYLKGEVIERCPLVIEDKPNILEKTTLGDYYWAHQTNPKKGVVALGLCSLYNHSDDNNVNNYQDLKNDLMIFKANKNIKKGEEMFIHYGDNYWNFRS